MLNNKKFIQRCIDLANFGSGSVSPNPKVGAVIVSGNKIIGEGYHKAYGKEHAEVNAVNSVSVKNKALIKSSEMHVSLEPCCIFGNTPPCTKLIIDLQIPKLFISVKDFTPGVSGNGIQQLKEAGIQVESGILESKGKKVAAFRNTFVTKGRPYVILKYAKSKDGFMGKKGSQVWLTNEYSKRMVHKWRSEIDAVLVGTNTAETDNPELTTRFNFGRSPVRIVLDKNLRLKHNLKFFDGTSSTVIITMKKPSEELKNVKYIQPQAWNLYEILQSVGELKITSLIVEGGKKLLDSIIQEGLWEESRVFTADKYLESGIAAPEPAGFFEEKHQLDTDILEIFTNNSPAG